VSQEAVRRVNAGYEALKVLLNAGEVCEVLCGSSSTMVVSNFARAIGPTCKPGQEIIVTDTDHECNPPPFEASRIPWLSVCLSFPPIAANISPWNKMAQEHGLVIKVWKVDVQTQELQLSDLEKLLTENTRLGLRSVAHL